MAQVLKMSQVLIPFISGLVYYITGLSYLLPDKCLNPFYFRAGLLQSAPKVDREVDFVLIPFISGLVYYYSAYEAKADDLVLIPFISGLVYYLESIYSENRKFCLNPFYFRAGLLQIIVYDIEINEMS